MIDAGHVGAELDAELDRARVGSLGLAGTARVGQMLHGQLLPPTLTVTLDEGAPMLALSSVARARSVACPAAAGVHVYDHELVPEAGCQLLASVETSTPPTTPPPLSVAVPDTVTGVPTLALLPDAGGGYRRRRPGAVRTLRSGDEPGLECRGLGVHVGQQVHRGLLDVRICAGPGFSAPELGEKHKDTTQAIFGLDMTPEEAAKQMEKKAVELLDK